MQLSTGGNLLLDHLSRETLLWLKPELQQYRNGVVLVKEGEIPANVYFPHRGAVVSIVRSTSDGSMVEAGIIGAEGIYPISAVIAAPFPSANQAIVQIDGDFTKVDAERLRELFGRDREFSAHLLDFTHCFIEQLTQNLICNRLHQIEQRLAKWLLMVRDRISGDSINLTHEFLSHMLGIHRPGVSIAVGALANAGLIEHGRNRIVIRDQPGLLRRSCECHRVNLATLQWFHETFEADVSQKATVSR
jgi:CRP-like cAMP-binding protein